MVLRDYKTLKYKKERLLKNRKKRRKEAEGIA